MAQLAIQENYADHKAAAPTVSRRVYVVDDNSDIRRSLHFSLGAIDVVAWPFACARDLLEQIDSLVPSPILLDVRMPEINGLELLSMLRRRGIDWPVIMMSAHGDIPTAVASIRSGAVDFLEKPFNYQHLEDLLNEAYARISESAHAAKRRDAAATAWNRLSKREAEVMQLLIAGARNKAVAHELKLSVRTVEIHRSHALAKLGVQTLSQAAVLHLTVSN